MGQWKHRLSDVDLEARTAVCAVDGPVSIYVSGTMRRCSVALGINGTGTGTERTVPPGQHRMLSKDEQTMTGVCALCGPVKVHRQKGGLRCINNKYHGDKLRMKTYLRQALRDGRPCEICGQVTENMNLDHKHGEKTWRGVLCAKHNTGLGMFDDDIDLLKAAIKYLQKHEKDANAGRPTP